MFESFRDRDLKDTGSCDELGAGAPVVQSKGGTTRESLIEGAKQKHTQREGLYDLRIRCGGVGHPPLHLTGAKNSIKLDTFTHSPILTD